jgi:hypothetical protein
MAASRAARLAKRAATGGAGLGLLAVGSAYVQTNKVRHIEVPKDSLLAHFAKQSNAQHADTYERTVELPPAALQPSRTAEALATEWAQAFFTSGVWLPERLVLRVAMPAHTREGDFGALSFREGDQALVFRVQHRAPSEMLLDARGFSKSYLEVSQIDTPDGRHYMRFRFGSALPQVNGFTRLLLPVHDLYSRVLLEAGARNFCARRKCVCV